MRTATDWHIKSRRQYQAGVHVKNIAATHNRTPGHIRAVCKGVKRGRPFASSAARKYHRLKNLSDKERDLLPKIKFFWERGNDTMRIAQILNEQESLIYNLLPLAKEAVEPA